MNISCQVFVLFVVCLSVGTVDGGLLRRLSSKTLSNSLLSYMCRGRNGLLCSGRGTCDAGRCLCNEGAYGSKCETPVEDTGTVTLERRSRFETVNPSSDVNVEEPERIMACFGNNEGVCNGNGVCVNGTCLCDPDWSGVVCEQHNRAGFCETYRSCAECTALSRRCPDTCDISADFVLVRDFMISGGTFHRCRYKNAEHNCRFYYQLSGISPSGKKTITVKTCRQFRRVTTTTSIPEITFTTERPIKEVTSSSAPEFLTEEMTTSQAVTTNSPAPATTTQESVITHTDFCNAYRECAECTALTVRCPAKCARMAHFDLVYMIPYSTPTFHRCRGRNAARGCSFYYAQDDANNRDGLRAIMVTGCFYRRSSTIPKLQTTESAVSSSSGSVETTTVVTTTSIDKVTSVQTDRSVDDRDDDGDDNDDERAGASTETIHDENKTGRNQGIVDDRNTASGLLHAPCLITYTMTIGCVIFLTYFGNFCA